MVGGDPLPHPPQARLHAMHRAQASPLLGPKSRKPFPKSKFTTTPLLLSVRRPPHLVAKTKLQSVGSNSGVGPDLLNFLVDGNPVDLVESFTYPLAVSKRLTDTAGRTSHVELVSRPRQCRHSITSGLLNIFLFRLKFVFIKHSSCQSCYMHPKHGPRLPVT